jgi:hypothetical protein
MTLSTSNYPAAGNAGIASRLTIGPHCPGVPEPGRKHSTMRIPFILVIAQMGLLTACMAATNSIHDNYFQVPAEGYPVSVEESGSAKVDALVRNLVSRRPAPYRSGYSDPPPAVAFADRYDTPEVEAALKSLKEMGPAAFPALVKHMGDDRYSYSGVVEAWLNFRVGDAVVEVLDDGHYMHSGYKYRKTPSGSDGGYLSFAGYLEARGAEAWAEWAKSRSRLDIQMDFIDWCIEKENGRGFVDEAQKKKILGNYESARQRVKKEYSEPDGPANGRQPIRSETNTTPSAAGSRR